MAFKELARRVGDEGGTARRACVVLLAVLVAVSSPVLGTRERSAQSASLEDSGVEQVEEPMLPLVHRVSRASSEIIVDAHLDEPAWKDAVSIPLAYETRPGENVDPPVETEVLLTFDENRVYIAFRAFDPDPSAIRAHLSDRDKAFNDDFVGVVLDTFNDGRRAVEFFVNPLGVQMDLFNDDVGRNETESWDAIWKSAGRITEEGYFVEMAIPFHQLRFPQSNGGPLTWGFDAIRFYPRVDRYRISIQPTDRDIDCYLCQVSEVVGFEGASPGRNMEFIPTLTSGRTDERQELEDDELQEGSLDTQVGLTARWGVTPNLMLNAALNPDFSQVEADVAQLDVNNQFALFFPERRPFFLEGADFFDTPLDAVFTRNVADPAWGLKITGKQDRNGLGVFVADDDQTNLIFPGSQGSDGGSFGFSSIDAVARYRRDFGSSSAIGALFTSREGGDYSNQVGGIDGLYRFTPSDSVRFQALLSRSEYPDEIAEDFEQPFGRFDDQAYFAGYTHNSRNWRAWARYEDIGKNFRADMGFMPKVDFKKLSTGGVHQWWGDSGHWFNRISVGAEWEQADDQSGQLLENEADTWVTYSGPRQSFVWFDVGMRDRFFDGVEFNDQFLIRGFLEMQPTGDVWFGLQYSVGDDIDFANVQQGEVLNLVPLLRVNLGLHIRADLEHTYEQLDVEGGRLFTANLSQFRLVYQFNVRSFVRGIFQYTRIDRDPGLYIDEVSEQSRDLFTQLLFSYKLNPQTVIFAGYTDGREGELGTSLIQTSRSVFLKLGYAWVP